MPETKIPRTFLATAVTSHVCRTCGEDRKLKSFPTIHDKPDERGTECRRCRDARTAQAKAEGKPARVSKPKGEKAKERVEEYNAKSAANKAAKAKAQPKDEVAAKRAAKAKAAPDPADQVECGTCGRLFSAKGLVTHRQRTGHGA